MLNDIKEMIAQVTSLQGNLQQLQQAMAGVNHFVDGVNRDVAKWRFKNAPRLERIQKIMDRLDEHK